MTNDKLHAKLKKDGPTPISISRPKKGVDKEFGFTLVEILVGLTIIGILFGFGYVGFRDFSRRQALAGSAKALQGDLRLTQSNALSGVKPTTGACNSPLVLRGYLFLVVSTTRYQIQSECVGGGSTTLGTVKDVTLPTGVTISTPSTNPIRFKVLGEGNNIPTGSNANIVLTQAGTGTTFTVTVTSGGEIR